MNIINGYIFDSKENIIVHQVNCQGVAGKGLALEIKNRFPDAVKSYISACKIAPSPNYLLGQCQICKEDGRIIAHLFGQLNYGNNKSVTYTKYSAVREGFRKLYEYCKGENLSIAIPYKIGCNLGGGDWNTVLNIIKEELKDLDYTIYKK